MDKILDAKKELRKQMLQKRNSLSEELIQHNSTVIMDKIKAMDAFISSRVVMSYVDFGSEVKTRDFISYCLTAGKRVLVPIIVKNPDGTKEMKASELYDMDTDLESGTMGILEPKEGKRRFVDPNEIDFFVVAGLAFDKSRNRLGYGGRFHDNVLKLVRPGC